MVISYKHQYIYIDIPKTGCTAIQNYLLENDETCEQGWIEFEGKRTKIESHTKTKEIRNVMGKRFDEFTVFTFIRHPKSRSVSAYFFYKNGSWARSRYVTRNIMAKLNVFLTKMLPFSIWSLIKSEKRITDYFYDDCGRELIDLVGKTGNMDEDLESICKCIGIPIRDVEVPVQNRSKHKEKENYYTNNWHRKMYKKKAGKDLKLYKKYEKTIYA